MASSELPGEDDFLSLHKLRHANRFSIKVVGKHGIPNSITYFMVSASVPPSEHFHLYNQALFYIMVDEHNETVILTDLDGQQVLTCKGSVRTLNSVMTVTIASIGEDFGNLQGYDINNFTFESQYKQLTLDKKNMAAQVPFKDENYIGVREQRDYINKFEGALPPHQAFMKSLLRYSLLTVHFQEHINVLHETSKALTILMGLRLMYVCYAMDGRPMPVGIPHLMPRGWPLRNAPFDSLRNITEARMCLAHCDANNRCIGEILHEPSHLTQLVIFIQDYPGQGSNGVCTDTCGRTVFRYHYYANTFRVFNTEGEIIGQYRGETVEEMVNKENIFAVDRVDNFPGSKAGSKTLVLIHRRYGQAAYCLIDNWGQMVIDLQLWLSLESKAVILGFMVKMAKIYYNMWRYLPTPAVSNYRFRQQ